MNKYNVGAKIICNEINGVVVPNYKLPNDICVEWETGMKSTYDVYWLDENVLVQNEQ